MESYVTLEEVQKRLISAKAERVEAQVRKMRDAAREEAVTNPRMGIYHLMGEIATPSSFHAMRAFDRFARLYPDKPIEFVITSPGGALIDGIALFDHILLLRRANPKIRFTTLGLGMAGSMAGIILQAGEVRAMSRETWLLIHESSFNVEGSVGEVKDRVDWIEKIHERIIDIFVSRSKVTRRQFITKWKRKDWWLSADEALELGFIDEVR